MTDIKIKLLDGGMMPERKTAGAVCYDCYARGRTDIPAGERRLVPLGFCLEMPDGWEAVLRPRSGLTKKGEDSCLGTIDSDYRGELMACLVNNTGGAITVKPGDRICQIAFRQVPPVALVQTDTLTETTRGSGGFGSTGV